MVKVGILLETGEYAYDPHEYHGPTMYYLTLPLLWLSGVREFAALPSPLPFLLIPVIVGTFLIGAVLVIREDLGNVGAVAAALLTAASPAMCFYSRYYIQEMLLVLLTFLAIVMVWRYVLSRHIQWLLGASLCAGMMLGTKETAAIALCICGVSSIIAMTWGKIERHDHSRVFARWWHMPLGILVAAAVAVTLLSAFFTNTGAILDAVQSYVSYISRGYTGDSSTMGASVHVHPWYFYLKRLFWFHEEPGPVWSEGLIALLALVGMVAVFAGKVPPGVSHGFAHFLAVFSLLLVFAYSAIPYKTPWNALGFLHAMILLAGVGVAVLLHMVRLRAIQAVVAAMLMAGAAQLGLQANRTIHRYAADTRNPWVYAGTSPNLPKLSGRVEELVALTPEGRATTVQIISPKSDYWPLPWYLRRLPNVGYYPELPEETVAPVVIVSSDLASEADRRLTGYHSSIYGLRADVMMTLYVSDGLWNKYLQSTEER